MALSTNFYRFSNPLMSIRGLIAVPNASGLSLPTWLFNSAYQWDGNTVQATQFSGQAQFGTVDAVAASGAGTLMTAYGTLQTLITAGGVPSTSAAATSGIVLFNGAATLGGSAYAVNGSGQVFRQNGAAWLQIGTFGAANPSMGLIANSTTLYSVQASQGRIASMTTGGVSGTVATPMTTPAILAASSGVNIAVGGWSTASIGSGFVSIAANPGNTSLFVGSNLATSGISIWTNNGNGSFALTQAVSGAGSNVSMAWSQSGSVIMGADTINNAVHVFTSSFGTVSLTQTITVTGAAAVAIALDSTHALVCQPSSNQIQGLGFNGSSWVTSGTVAIGNPRSVLAISQTQMLVGCSSGIATLTFSIVSGWNVTSVVSGVGFVPTALAVDPNGGGVAATATSGSNGLVYYNGASGSFVGSASGVVAQQGQILTADPTNSLLRLFANVGGTISQQASGAGLAGVSTVANVGNLVLASNGTTTQELQWGAPYTFSIVKGGVVSVYNGSTFSTLTMGAGHIPVAMAFDASNNLTVATLQNEIYVYNPATSAVVSSGSFPIFLGQSQATPYGTSSLIWASGQVWATSSMNESIMAISGVPL